MNQPVQTIVVGVGTVTEHDPVLEVAVGLAVAQGATLYAIHAFELPPVFGFSYRIRYTHPDAYLRFRQGLQSSLEDQVRRLSKSETVRYRALEGSPARVLDAVARRVQADLVLVGATRRGWAGGAILGTTAERVIRAATAPTLVLHGPLRLPMRCVLLTTDLSPLSAQAHARAVALLPALFEAPDIRILRVIWFDLPFLPPLSRERIVETARAELERFVAARTPQIAPVQARLRIGEPAEEIIAEAAEWGADLIVVGTKSRSGPSRFLLGSVAEATARGAPCNVLVIPPAALAGKEREPGAAAGPPLDE